MNNTKIKDEHLEKLWHMKETGNDSLEFFQALMKDEFSPKIMEELVSECLVEIDPVKNSLRFSPQGEERARQVIRAHRLAERMLHDVIGGDFETGACEFEHTVTPELVDSICTLLGHPKECPHGSPIPRGECCKSLKKTAESSVIPLKDLKIGQSAKVAFVSTKNDQQLHKIDGLHIRPGVEVKLHQVYPAYVIECEGVHIALDEDIASNISVWKKLEQTQKTKDASNKELSSRKAIKKQLFNFCFKKKNENKL